MNLSREVLRLALPAIVANLTVPVLGLVDTTVAGHLQSSDQLAAIAAGSMMINMLPWLCGFLRMGTTGLTANAFGACDRLRCVAVIRKSLLIVLVLSALFLILQKPLRDLLLYLMNPGESVAMMAGDYFSICIAGIPGQLCMMAVTGWFIGLQNTRVPMFIAVGMNVVNIFLDIYLALGAGMGVSGIALGTAISNWAGAIASVTVMTCWIRGGKGPLPPKRRAKREERKEREQPSGNMARKDSVETVRAGEKEGWEGFFRVNGALLLRSACIMAVSLAMTSFASRMGSVTLAANAVMMQFFIFFSYFIDGFAFAGEAMAGRYYGGGDMVMLRRSVRTLLWWGAGMGTLFLLVYALWSGNIAEAITDKEDVLVRVADMRLWMVLLPALTVLAFVFDGIYVGITQAGAMLQATLTAALVFFAVTCHDGHVTDSFTLLWMAFDLYLLIRGLYLAVCFRKKIGGAGL